MAAELPKPHHDREDVGVVPEEGAPPHVLLDQLLALLVVGVVDDLLLLRELELLQRHRLRRQRDQRPTVHLFLQAFSTTLF